MKTLLRLAMSAKPQHIGIIMDGNRRWARRRGKPPRYGHEVGFGRVPLLLGWLDELGIDEVTLWMLSTENLRRSPDEISALASIICRTVAHVAQSGRYQIRHLGSLDVLPDDLSVVLGQLPRNAHGRMTVNLAVGYGGQDEVIRAARELLASHDHSGSGLSGFLDRVSPESLDQLMSSAGNPPDLIIRTSGEKRLSGFMLWSGTEAYLHFERSMWPAFGQWHLARALRAYRRAELRQCS